MSADEDAASASADAVRACEREIDAAIARTGADAYAELARDGGVHAAGVVDELAAPAGLRRMLARASIASARWRSTDAAIAIAPGDEHDRSLATELARHYLERSPRMRVAQVAGCGEPEATVFHAPLEWQRLPRLAGAIDRLYAELARAGVDEDGCVRALGAPTAEAWRARSPTLATAYARTYYGGMMPLLHGQSGELAYFLRRAGERGLDVDGAIDRYLTSPLVHELCHLGRDREALEPVHLDECIGGWLCTQVHREFAVPEDGEDDAIYGAPWLVQVGSAIARAFGEQPVVAAHAGARGWANATSAGFVAAAARLGWADWCARRSLHLLADTLDPMPWVALAFAAARGHALAGVTLDELRALPLGSVAPPEDPVRDRAIVEDALRAMCLEGVVADGTLRTRTAIPAGPIVVDPVRCVVTSPRRGVDSVDPVHWLPPAVAARLAGPVQVRLERLDAIPEVAEALCRGSVR